MVLAAFGTNVAEVVLERYAHVEERGMPINELERLADRFHLRAEICDIPLEQLEFHLQQGKLPIAFIDRRVFDLTPDQRKRHSIRDAIIHTVIPTRVTTRSVTFHDPLPPRIARRSIRLFRPAYMSLGGRCVLCASPDEK
jgi:hypothetical protein